MSTGAAAWECEQAVPPDEGVDVPRAGFPTAILAAAPHLEGAGHVCNVELPRHFKAAARPFLLQP